MWRSASASLLLAVVTVGCAETPKPLFAADCHDGSRISGTEEVAEARCARRGGVRALTPLDGPAAPPASTPS